MEIGKWKGLRGSGITELNKFKIVLKKNSDLERLWRLLVKNTWCLIHINIDIIEECGRNPPIHSLIIEVIEDTC